MSCTYKGVVGGGGEGRGGGEEGRKVGLALKADTRPSYGPEAGHIYMVLAIEVCSIHTRS